jgi:hypothetical protein
MAAPFLFQVMIGNLRFVNSGPEFAFFIWAITPSNVFSQHENLFFQANSLKAQQ